MENLTKLSKYIEVSTAKYSACMGQLPTTSTVKGLDSTVRFQHLLFDQNGQPKFLELAEVLADHIIEYCFSSRRRGRPRNPNEYARLSREGRAYLRRLATSGESGEMLLYFLIEAVLKAPQIVAKMELKTNPRMECHGSDGIHIKWCDDERKLDLYFGESKIEKSVHSALDNMVNSLNSFHMDGLIQHEYGLVTSHYKHAHAKTRKLVLDLLDRKTPGGDCRVNHACLVGYDWNEYGKLSPLTANKIQSEFIDRYQKDSHRLTELIGKKFENFKHRHLRFEIFFLPFRTVQEFRDAFNKSV